MKKHHKSLAIIFGAVQLLGLPAIAAEEALDLETVAPPVSKTAEHGNSGSGPRIMGRADLTYDKTESAATSKFYNNHFLIFVKAQATERVGFFGQIVGGPGGATNLLDLSYKASDLMTMHLGRPLVPFGDTSRFHHFYGGVQENSLGGNLFPNIWSKPGFDLEWSLGSWTLDSYVINGFENTGTEPSLSSTNDGVNVAAGLRGTKSFGKVRAIGSFLYQEWVPGQPLYLAGLDGVTDYNLVPVPVLRNLRLYLGRAIAYIQQGASGSFHRSGDYAELTTNITGIGEQRVRYGTYVNNSREVSTLDVHNWNVAQIYQLDALRFMLEHQWNMEEINERPNDVTRLMVSLDF